MLVAKGYNQIKGVDYYDSFSPVAKTVTVRLMLALTDAKQWHLHQLDVSNTFLHDNLDEESSNDHCLFVLNQRDRFMMLIVYADDILVAGPSEEDIIQVKQLMHNEFTIKDLGVAKYFLGIEIARAEEGMYLSQTKYITDILQDLNMEDCTAVATPLQVDWQPYDDTSLLLADASVYRRLVGRLLYLDYTRPNVTHTIHQLSQFMQQPTTNHWHAALHIVMYLKGYCVMIGSSLLSWESKKHNTVSRSSVEAEYRSMAFAVCELQWLTYLFVDLMLSLQQPITIWCDNQSAIYITECSMKGPNISRSTVIQNVTVVEMKYSQGDSNTWMAMIKSDEWLGLFPVSFRLLLFFKSKSGVVRIICRDEEGSFLGAQFRQYHHVETALVVVETALVVEAMKLQDGLTFAIQQGYGRIEVESDSRQLIRVISGQQKTPLLIDVVVADIHHLAKYLEVKFQYTNRRTNKAAYCVAYWNHCGAQEATWLSTPPNWLFMPILHDLTI
ncbi:transmembrane signal receptor [Lithospermum erythrorhizon]|uniref:Transmembrane signal receptor n=1 Tax=Lithospermum erythrorhizon TaxID=34254 RepID=A0AAV3QAS3_LITER